MSVVALTSLLVVAPLSQLHTTLGEQEWLILGTKKRKVSSEVDLFVFYLSVSTAQSSLSRPIHVVLCQVV